MLLYIAKYRYVMTNEVEDFGRISQPYSDIQPIIIIIIIIITILPPQDGFNEV